MACGGEPLWCPITANLRPRWSLQAHLDAMSGVGEMYDLGTDPQEMDDLWFSEHASTERERLMALIHDRERAAMSSFADPVGMT